MTAHVCERDGCDQVARLYYCDGRTVHVNLGIGLVSMSAGGAGTHRDGNKGWITLCAAHALKDLGVAFP